MSQGPSSSPTTPLEKGVERIVSPMKPLQISKKGLFFDSESGYEQSSSSSTGITTPEDFFSELVKLLPYIKETPIQLKVVNKKLHKLLKFKRIPGLKDLQKITDPEVT